VGEHVAVLVAAQYASLEDLTQASEDDLTAIEGVGPVVAKSIVDFFNQTENMAIVQRMIDSRVQIVFDRPAQTGGLSGKTFVLTGTLATMTRRQAKAMIEAANGKVSSSVSGKTTYLVAGESPGSKLAKARELGIEILDETEFKELISS
jgi:DNA ligase (NAD+)